MCLLNWMRESIEVWRVRRTATTCVEGEERSAVRTAGLLPPLRRVVIRSEFGKWNLPPLPSTQAAPLCLESVEEQAAVPSSSRASASHWSSGSVHLPAASCPTPPLLGPYRTPQPHCRPTDCRQCRRREINANSIIQWPMCLAYWMSG